jgi:uncharacterized protein
MNLGLSTPSIVKIKAIFGSFPEIEKAILYGSRAKGNYKKGSDIDLTLIGENLNHKLLNQISNQIEELYLPEMVDLSIFHQIENEDLIEHINRVGIPFYEK